MTEYPQPVPTAVHHIAGEVRAARLAREEDVLYMASHLGLSIDRSDGELTIDDTGIHAEVSDVLLLLPGGAVIALPEGTYETLVTSLDQAAKEHRRRMRLARLYAAARTVRVGTTKTDKSDA